MTDRRWQWIAAVVLTAGLPCLPTGALCADDRSDRDQPATRRVRRGNPSHDGLKGSGLIEEHRLPPPGRDTYGDVATTLLALAVVVAMIFLARYLLRRLAGVHAGTRRLAAMEVMARTRVSPRQQLLLVRLGKRLVLTGCGPGSLTALAEVTDPDDVADLIQAAEQSRPASLGDLLKRKSSPETAAKEDRP